MASQPHVTPLADGPRLLNAGDAAFTIEFGQTIAPDLMAAVQALDVAITRHQEGGHLQGLVETMPTFRSLTVFFDPLLTDQDTLMSELWPLLTSIDPQAPVCGQGWNLPVCYEGECGPDLIATAQTMGTTVDHLIALHTGAEYRVCMIGFLPGFPFMHGLAPAMDLPRRAEPRVRVPAGSVAIAGGLTAIYPWESPGGWHLLGRCPVPLFDASRSSPSLLAPGDRVRFHAVGTDEFQRLHHQLQAGEWNARQWMAADGEMD